MLKGKKMLLTSPACCFGIRVRNIFGEKSGTEVALDSFCSMGFCHWNQNA